VALALGIDVGGTKILAAAVDDAGEVVVEERVESPKDGGSLFDAIGDAVALVVARLGGRAAEVHGAGAGLPGLIDLEGVLHDAPNLPAAANSAAGAELRRRVEAVLGRRMRVVVENDATAAAAGELAFGAARSVANAVVVTLGTGIGGGLVGNGRLLRGERGFAGEIGHMVVELDGPRCACGGQGCWEQFASGTGLARLGREAALGGASPLLAEALAARGEVRGEDVVDAARRGDGAALDVVAAFARYLAIGLSNLAEIFDPGRLILGGGLVRAADVLFATVPERFAEHRRGAGEAKVDIVVAELGERAGVAGAAALALGLVT